MQTNIDMLKHQGATDHIIPVKLKELWLTAVCEQGQVATEKHCKSI